MGQDSAVIGKRHTHAERGHDLYEWRPIPGWETYEVSSCGRVRRLAGTAKTPFGRNLASHVNSKGYPTVHLRQDGKERQMPVHVAVLLAFVGPKPTPEHHGAHWDGDPLNSDVTNLRWATPKENNADKLRHGTLLYGQSHPSARLSDGDVSRILEMQREGKSYRRIADAVGCSEGHVYKIVRGKRRAGPAALHRISWDR